MGEAISDYELSLQAEQDVEDIFDYTLEKFGLEQAVTYTSELEPVFYQLVANPELGQSRHEIRKGLRSVSYRSHVIFYRILKTRIRIVRVLHSARDLPRLL